MDFRCKEKKYGDRLDEPGTGADGISMNRKAALKARMWLSIVIQESCVICEGIVSNRKIKEKYTDGKCIGIGLEEKNSAHLVGGSVQCHSDKLT